MENQSEEVPQEFYDRADALIHLANAQLKEESIDKVSASTLYAAARFNAFTSATFYSSGEDMTKDMSEIIDYFVEQYRLMLEENLEDHAANFAKYIR